MPSSTSKIFRVSAKGVVRMDGKILLLRKAGGMWDLPGGRIEDGEEPEAALVREILEETGIEVRPVRLIHGFVRPKPSKPDVFVAAYLCDAFGPFTRVVLSHEHEEARLFSQDEISGLKMEEGYKDTIRRARL